MVADHICHKHQLPIVHPIFQEPTPTTRISNVSFGSTSPPTLKVHTKMKLPPLKYGGSPRSAQIFISLLARLRSKAFALIMFPAIVLVTLFLYIGGHVTLGRKIPHSTGPQASNIVRLPGYGTFQGTQILSTLVSNLALEEPVDAWLGINYSTQPIGPGRFAPVTWPEPVNGTVDASDYGPACPQPGGDVQSEACLHFNVYRTANVSKEIKLPVFIMTHGGAFVVGGARSFDGATFVSKSSQPLMVVTFQYRLGVLGSLPSDLFEEEHLLNLALRDQRHFLEFMQKYIVYFGGDPDRITLGGQSAGAHSVGVHLFHDYDSPSYPAKKLFSQAILSSGSATARSFPPPTFPLLIEQFTTFMTSVNCPTSSSTEALSCLRSVDVSSIVGVQTSVFNAAGLNWPFQPVSFGPLLEKPGSASGANGTFFSIPILTTSCTNEGAGFVPTSLETNSDFTEYFRNLLPGLTDTDIDDLQTLYPEAEYPPDESLSQSGQYLRVSAAYADYAYICPVQETSVLLSPSTPVYKARFNTPNWAPAGQGVPHASDGAYFNGKSDVEFPEISRLYASYYASFIVSGDPNKFAVEGKTEWPMYTGLGSRELAVGSPERGGVVVEEEGEGIRMEACGWWRDAERMVRLNK
jgi:acetylcholinesterase